MRVVRWRENQISKTQKMRIAWITKMFLAIYYVSCTYTRLFVETVKKDCVVRPLRPHDSFPILTPQILKFAPNEVKECRNRSENLINRKRTNFCIEATPPKNSQRKKNNRKIHPKKNIFEKCNF